MKGIHQEIILGIDAGGSKTLAIAAGANGEILASGQSGPANFHAVGLEEAAASMNTAVQKVLLAVDAAQDQVRAIGIGAAGADRPDDREVWLDWAHKAFPGAVCQVTNDAMLVLAAGLPDGWGLAVISGTGSIVYGRDPQGRLARSGGWGYLIGDEGSNYSIGVAALRAVARAKDHRAPQTRLTDAVLRHWKLHEPAELVKKVYSNLPRREIAGLGRVVESVAETGDPVAFSILEEAGWELALSAASVVLQLGLQQPVPCALAGSALVYGKWVRPAFLRAAETQKLDLAPLNLVAEPARGAVKLAIEALRRQE